MDGTQGVVRWGGLALGYWSVRRWRTLELEYSVISKAECRTCVGGNSAFNGARWDRVAHTSRFFAMCAMNTLAYCVVRKEQPCSEIRTHANHACVRHPFDLSPPKGG